MKRVWSLSFRLGLLGALVATSACGQRGASAPSGGDGPPAGDGPPNDRPADEPSVFRNLRTHLDLLELPHLADVDHHGLYVDFGTPARLKYTIGNWRTGFGHDEAAGATTFTPIESQTGRIYFPVDHPGALTLRLRARTYGTRNMQLYLNNKPLPSVRFTEGAELRDYDVAVPAESVVRGENYLLMRFGGTTHVGDRDLAIALDSLRVIEGAPDPSESFSAPVFGELATEVRVGGVQRRALAVRAPTTLSWYVEVPPGGKLGFGLAAEGEPPSVATAKIVVTPDGGPPQEIFSRAVTGRWSDTVLPLERWVGQAVRIDMRVEGRGGAGRVGWSTPAILVPPRPDPAERHPAKNVVLLLIDTMRADHLQPFNAATRVRAPSIARIAQEGTIFTSAQSPENWTKPATASILTGLWPMTHRAKTDEARLPAAATLLSEMLKEADFATASFIANGFVSDRFGFNQGWDVYHNYIRDNRPTEAEAVFRDAGDWIEQHKSERFFAYVHTIDPHVPYDPPAQYLRMYDGREYLGQVLPRQTADLLERAKRNPPAVVFDESDRRRLEALYDGEVSYHDHHLGEFIDRLDRLHVLADTLFVVVADHGEEFADHGSWGHGHTMYQELLHVPLMFRLPGSVPAAQRIDTTVSSMDLLPTILDTVGLPVPQNVEARSLVGFIRGNPPPGPAVAFSEFLDDRRVIRAGRWKLILRGPIPTLFDLQTDPGEQHELRLEDHPVAMRYCRVLIGQFLGVENRAHWLSADQSAPGAELQQENAVVDPEMCRQLGALGYANAACRAQAAPPPPGGAPRQPM